MKQGLTTRQSVIRVWTPDAVGSVCFLVASVLAYAEVCHRWVCWRARSLSWWITALNLLGSIFFGLAALGAIIDPATKEPVAARLDNAGTALGGVCFLVGGTAADPRGAPRPGRGQPWTSLSRSKRMIRAAASISARWENAWGKLPRWRPVLVSNSSA